MFCEKGWGSRIVSKGIIVFSFFLLLFFFPPNLKCSSTFSTGGEVLVLIITSH